MKEQPAMKDTNKTNQFLREETVENWSSQISAIARGVEARPEFLTRYLEVVIQDTVKIARRLQIPNEEIERWVATRQVPDFQTHAAIKASE